MKVVMSTAALVLAACVHLSDAQSKAMDTSKTLRRFAFGSNVHEDLPQPIWAAIEKTNPEIFLSLGNNIYGDDTAYEWKSLKQGIDRDAEPRTLQEKYEKQRNNTDYARFIQSTPVVGIWDDHDYGSNDGSREYEHRDLSQELFLDFIGEVEDSPRRSQAGIYTSYTFGSGAQTVKFILLDTRYHKDPYISKNVTKNVTDFNGQNGDILGEAQWTWLEAQLHESTAAFHVIGSALQVLPKDRWFGSESWSAFSLAQERFVTLLQVSKASGVVLLSGNVEHAEVNQVQCGDTGAYKLTEVTSSGLTHSALEWSISPFHLASAFWYTVSNAFLPWYYRADRDAHFGGLNFGDVRFDWTVLPPTAVVSVKDVHGRVKLQTSIPSTRFNEPAENAGCWPIHEISPGDFMVRVLSMAVVLVLFFGSLVVNAVVVVVVPLQLVWRLVSGSRAKAKTE